MIKFSCQFCGNPMYAEDSDAGALATCPNADCGQTIEVPTGTTGLSGNPFYRPIATFSRSLQQLTFSPPYLPQIIQVLITSIILVVLGILFGTIGIAAQIASMFQRLIHEAKLNMQRAQSAERTGYAVAIGIYRLLLFPFWLVQVPVRIIASVLEHPSSAAFIVVIAAAAIYLHSRQPEWWTHFMTTCRGFFAQ